MDRELLRQAEVQQKRDAQLRAIEEERRKYELEAEEARREAAERAKLPYQDDDYYPSETKEEVYDFESEFFPPEDVRAVCDQDLNGLITECTRLARAVFDRKRQIDQQFNTLSEEQQLSVDLYSVKQTETVGLIRDWVYAYRAMKRQFDNNQCQVTSYTETLLQTLIKSMKVLEGQIGMMGVSWDNIE